MRNQKKNSTWCKRLINITMKGLFVVATLLSLATSSPEDMNAKTEWAICSQLMANFEVPCLCSRISHNSTHEKDSDINMEKNNESSYYYIFNCDHVSLSGNFPTIPYQLPVQGFSHRYGGFQTLQAHLFSDSDIPLRWVDLSHNHLQRLTNGMFEGIERTIEEVYLSHNYLGHQLNPVFATEELNTLTNLKVLDISHNRLKALDDGVFHKLTMLRILHLDGNYFDTIPTSSLDNLINLNILNLQLNQISHLRTNDFSGITSLKVLNLTRNVINQINPRVFSGFEQLIILDLSKNKLQTLNNPDTFAGLETLQELDLSHNFLHEVPSMALRTLHSLKKLHLGSNGIRELRLDDFSEFSALEYLDLSTNRIAELPPTVFSHLSNLNELVLDVNLVRKVEEPAFEGLQNLQRLSMNDNTVLGLPTKALAALPSLKSLKIAYNRIAAISPDLLRPVKDLQELALDFNLIREIPEGTFHNFTDLQRLSLRGNHIGAISHQTFLGLQQTLLHLDLSANGLDEYPSFESFPNMEELDLAENNIRSLPVNVLATLPSLKVLNISKNRLVELSLDTFSPKSVSIKHIDLSGNDLKLIPRGVLDSLNGLEKLDLSYNEIQQIESGTFHSLPSLHHINLSNNKINSIRHNALGDIHNLRFLNLSRNHLSVFDGEIFQSLVPKLEVLDLSHNQIHYLIPNALSLSPRLKYLAVNANKLTIFLEGLLQETPLLETLLLKNNNLQQIDGGQFSHALRLRDLDLSNNQIEAVGDNIFRNSSQVRNLNLANNKLTALPEAAFDNLACLNLDLSNNNLTSLPGNIFAKNHVANLLSINLAFNQFTRLPLATLNEQFASLQDLNVANNHILHVPANANALVNVKRLNLANNPLSEQSLKNIFSEPKTVQELNMANCGVKELTDLETPFLRTLNLSGNSITSLSPKVFVRTTMLESLDLSNNQIRNLQTDLSPIWPKMTNLKTLDLSGNPVQDIGPNDFDNLVHLVALNISRLEKLGRLDHEALTKLTSLKHLSIYGYPRLGFYDLHSILDATPALQSLQVEIKGMVLRDQLHPAFNPSLHHLILYGKSLKNLTSVSFAGLLAPSLNIEIHETSINSIPNTIFLPVPTSTSIQMDLSNNRITVFGPQLLMTLNEKRHHVTFRGLDANPLYCDCFTKPMHKWIKERKSEENEEWRQLACSGPEELKGRLIWSLHDDDLTCEKRSMALSTATSVIPNTEIPPPPLAIITTTEEEPDIIYEPPSPRPSLPDAGQASNSLTNMDSMIIGIIVGVVAFVCILIIIICIIKLRHNRVHYHATTIGMSSAQTPCTCLKPSNGPPTAICHCHPNYPPHPSHAGLVPAKLLAVQNESRSSTLQRVGPYPNPPYYITYPESEHSYR